MWLGKAGKYLEIWYQVWTARGNWRLLCLLQVLLNDLLLVLENKEFTNITLRVGLGWASGLQEGQIRSSADIADEVTLPPDFAELEEKNSLDVQVGAGRAFCNTCMGTASTYSMEWGKPNINDERLLVPAGI